MSQRILLHHFYPDVPSCVWLQGLRVLAVNLVYRCMFSMHPEELMQSLVNNLSAVRIEINFFSLKEPDFTNVDNRLMALRLVKLGLTRVIIFVEDGIVLQPPAYS